MTLRKYSSRLCPSSADGGGHEVAGDEAAHERLPVGRRVEEADSAVLQDAQASRAHLLQGAHQPGRVRAAQRQAAGAALGELGVVEGPAQAPAIHDEVVGGGLIERRG